MRVLMSVASKHGATDEIGHAIAGALREAGVSAIEVEPDAVTGIDAFDAVVLGSAVYAGRWQESMRKLVERERDALAVKPVWLFSSGPLGDPPAPATEPIDGAELKARIGAREHRVFAGRLDRHELGIGERAIAAVVRAPDGDYRPWTEIRAWAADIARALKEVPAGAR